MGKKKHVHPLVIDVERRVHQLGDGFDARKRLRELYDQMQPLLETWQENKEDEKKLNDIEQEVRAVGVVIRSEGKVRNREMVSDILDEIASDGVSNWLENEVCEDIKKSASHFPDHAFPPVIAP